MMKQTTILEFLVLLFACSHAGASLMETDEISMSDSQLSQNRLLKQYLEAANLTELGFKRSVEFSSGIGENGDRQQKKIIRYMIRDNCSMVSFWQEQLRSRFPPEFFSTNLMSTFAQEVEDRITGRVTSYCDIGLELVIIQRKAAAPRNGRVKRRWRIRIDIRIRKDALLKTKIKYAA